MDRDIDRWTADGQEQLKQRRCEQGHQQNQHARHQQVNADARPDDATDAVPFVRPDILRNHGADRATHSHGGHLHIAPQLVHHAECSRGVHAFAIHQPDHDHGRARHDNHRQAHGQTHTRYWFQKAGVRAQPCKLGPAQANGQVKRIDLAQQQGEADDPGNDCRQSRAGDTHCGDWTKAKNEDRIEDDVEHDIQDRVPKWRDGIADAAQR